MHGNLLLGLAGIIVLGIAAQLLAWRLHVPSILVLLLAIGVAFWKLTAQPPAGYGMSVGEFFGPLRPPTP